MSRRESVPIFWRNIQQYYRLLASRCKTCGATHFPQKIRCTCGSTDMEPVELPRRGTLIEFTVVYQTSPQFEKQRPLIIGVVDLNGVRVVGQVVDVDVDRLRPGAEVELVYRKYFSDGRYGIIYYGYKFRPVVVGGYA